MPGKQQTFEVYAEDLARRLRLLGMQAAAETSLDAAPTGSIIVLVGLHRFGEYDVRMAARANVVVGIQIEQLVTPAQGARRFGVIRLPAALRNLRHIDAVVDWNRENLAHLQRHHRNAHWAPYGLVEADRYPSGPERAPVHDVAFVGHLDALDGRRRRLLDELSSSVSVHPVSEGARGEDKFRVFAESRIVLNLHVEVSAVFEAPRFYDALGARRPLISEPAHDPWPFTSGHDFVEAYGQNLRRTVLTLLEDEPLQRRLVARGRRTVERHGLEAVASSILRLGLVSHEARRI